MTNREATEIEKEHEAKIKHQTKQYTEEYDRITQDFIIEKLRLTKEIKEAREEIKQVEEDRRRFEKDKADVDLELMGLRKLVREETVSLEDLRKQKAEAQSALKTLGEKHKADTIEYVHRIDQRRNKMGRVRQEVDRIQKEKSQAALDLLEQVAQANKEKEALAKDIAELEERKERLECETLCFADKEALNLDTLEKQQEILSKRVEQSGTLQAELQELKTDLETAKKELADNRAAFAPLSVIRDEIDVKKKELQAQGNKNRTDLRLLDRKTHDYKEMVKNT